MAGARRFATELLQDPEHALETLAREELGLNPTDLGSPWGAALFSFFSFTFGALIPLLPFLAGFGIATKNTGITLIVTALLAGVSLFLIGATLSLFTGRKALWSGLRMLIIGAGAGLITFLIGHVLGVSLS